MKIKTRIGAKIPSVIHIKLGPFGLNCYSRNITVLRLSFFSATQGGAKGGRWRGRRVLFKWI